MRLANERSAALMQKGAQACIAQSEHHAERNIVHIYTDTNRVLEKGLRWCDAHAQKWRTISPSYFFVGLCLNHIIFIIIKKNTKYMKRSQQNMKVCFVLLRSASLIPSSLLLIFLLLRFFFLKTTIIFLYNCQEAEGQQLESQYLSTLSHEIRYVVGSLAVVMNTNI